MPFYAHSLPDQPQERWEPLFTPFGSGPDHCQRDTCEKCRELATDHGHLNKVAYRTATFAAAMFPPGKDRDAAWQWGYLAGLWHDLGKFSGEFQARLAGDVGHVDHSTAGARKVSSSLPQIGQLLAYLIAGHHAGLADWNQNGEPGDLERRLHRSVIPDWEKNCPGELLQLPELPPLPIRRSKTRQVVASRHAFFARLLFSCLVDADFLATEAFMNPDARRQRPEWPSGILQRMDTGLSDHFSRTFGPPIGPIPEHRESVRRDCIQAAPQSPGLFTLTVPTGGGKTLSSLAFALRHAATHGLRRVVYVIPYTSIIEQNAKVFRDAFEELADSLPEPLRSLLVLEHHSNFDPKETSHPESADPTAVWKLASENWDSPLVVTTSVQFFESLHANKTSRCRKLHNLSRSVIILDEAQNLPVDLLAPCLESIRHLTRLAGSSVVLCTATQPAIGKRPDPADPFNKIALDLPPDGSREIIRDVPGLFSAFKRVNLSPPAEWDDESLAARLLDHARALCILNTKRHATKVFELLGADDPANFHLSAQLCPAHRHCVLTEIRRREQAGEPCRVIATTVVEAGVDLDFPVVFRAIAGLDSLAQAAGRCNRHGRGGANGGTVQIFTPANEKTPGFLTQNINSTRRTLPDFHSDQLLDPKAIETYFRSYFWLSGGENGRGWDKPGILQCFAFDPDEPAPFTFNFKEAARSFKLIEDTQAPVIVEPCAGLWAGINEEHAGEIRRLISTLRESSRQGFPPPLNSHRMLQRYTIQIPKSVHAAIIAEGIVELLHDRFPVLNHPQNHYDHLLGLIIPGHLDKPGAFII